jgi:zinc-binding alcohol dehydrogenase family protein
MKAVVVSPEAFYQNFSTSLKDADVPMPVLAPRDLLIRVEAVSVNPIDLKMARAKPPAEGIPRVLGWDAAGVVSALGSEVLGFRVGDSVYYAGSVIRQGCFSEFQSVDERLVALAPKSLSSIEATAMPLSALAAWEALFERMQIPQQSGGDRIDTLLVLGGAGGVGSMAIQLAAQLTNLYVIATASRAESKSQCLAMGAHSTIDHTAPLAPQLKALGRTKVNNVLCLSEPSAVLPELVQSLAPFAHVCSLVEATASLDINMLRAKSISFSWEGVFTRSIFNTPDMAEQGVILRKIAEFVDTGLLKSTLTQHLGPIDAKRLMKAHAYLKTQRTLGKICMG